MAINLTSPSTFTAGVLIGDTVQGNIPSMTKVGGVPISAALEVQSGLGGFVLPRMTTTQRLAIVTPVNGMQVYDTTLNDIVTYANGAWTQQNLVSGTLYATGSLTATQINSMFGVNNPIQLIAAPGAGKTIIVKTLTLNLRYVAGFTGGSGGAISLQFDNVATPTAANIITATIPSGFLAGAGASGLITVAGVSGNLLSGVYLNKGVYISNATAAFTGGAGSTVTWNVWYSIITAA